VQLFKKPDLPEQCFKKAERHMETWRREFDLRQAIEQYKLAVSLRPEEPRYRVTLGLTYLRIPQMAITRQIQIPYRLSDSVNLAAVEFEKAAALSKECRGYPAITCMCLGDDDKAIRVLRGFRDGWESSVSKENADTIFQLMKSSQSRIMLTQPPWNTKKIEEETTTLNNIGLILAAQGEEGKNRFARLMNSGPLLSEVKIAGLPDRNSKDAMKHLEQAIVNRDRGKHRNAEIELQNAWVMAPGLVWWYSTLYKLLV
jgi:hypothetical protein